MTPKSATEVERITPPLKIARALGMAEDGASVIVRRRRMYVNDVPVQLADSYIPADIAEGMQLAEVDSGPGGIISCFADLEHAQVRITERARSRRGTDEEQILLHLEDDQTVLDRWMAVPVTVRGRVAASFRQAGRKPAARAYDAMIAATALSGNLPVYTCNPADFDDEHPPVQHDGTGIWVDPAGTNTLIIRIVSKAPDSLPGGCQQSTT